MRIYIRGLLLVVLLLGRLSLSIGQTQLFDGSRVDSLTFSRTRAVIDQLLNAAFEKHVFKQDHKELPYRLLLPKNLDSHKKYPLIITLHNSSRIGTDNEKQLEHLTKTWLRDDIYDKYQAFVIAPHFSERSSNYSMVANRTLVSKPYADIQMVLDLIHQMQGTYNIDPSRIYLVGYSMGASTAQNLMNLSPKTFAALVSVAAVPDFSNLQAWKNKNLYLIHGKLDVDNPYSGSVTMFNKLKGNKKMIFKTYNELDHNNITIPLLLNDDIPSWLFKQRR